MEDRICPDLLRAKIAVKSSCQNTQTLDGVDALPDPRHEECRHRKELVGAGLQLQTRNQHPGYYQDDEGGAVGGRIGAIFSLARSRTGAKTTN